MKSILVELYAAVYGSMESLDGKTESGWNGVMVRKAPEVGSFAPDPGNMVGPRVVEPNYLDLFLSLVAGIFV